MKARGDIMYKVGIFGDTGMVGQEIDKILLKHNLVEVVFRKNSKRTEGCLSNCQIVFLATKDEESMLFAQQAINENKRVIDMSGAFRLDKDRFEKWYKLEHKIPELIDKAVYGMPAYFRNEISKAQLVANPGCYSTSIILALRPLKNLVKGHASIVATSGNSGARKEIESTPNEITYSFGTKHKHVPEMIVYSGFDVDFTPIVLRSVFRGINSNIRVELEDELKLINDIEAADILRERIKQTYKPEDLVFIVKDNEEKTWGTNDVVNTHKTLIKIRIDHGFAYICSMLDNLGKGAASQAVENMNIMFGIDRLYGINSTYKTE